jgi:putative membrane protein
MIGQEQRVTCWSAGRGGQGCAARVPAALRLPRNSSTETVLVHQLVLSLEEIVGLLSKYLVTGSSIAALGLLLAAGPVPAQSIGEKTGVNSALDIAPTTGDFVKEVANSDMFEIESSKLAQEKGNAREKTFASQMVTDHTKTSTELKGLVTDGKVKAELPTVLDSSDQSKLDKLKAANGKDFSSDFDSYQVSAHKDAISLFERYAKGGDNADLKNWAGKTLPTLRQHLEMAENLKRSGGST